VKRFEKVLVWLLRVSGVLMLVALGAVVMPFEWMNLIHQKLGLGILPEVPIVNYLARSASALYAVHGALLIFAASDVRRYLSLVRFLAWVAVALGPLMIWIDHTAGMPLLWTVCEGPYIFTIGLVLLGFASRVQTRQPIA
jgi:hypothetical protein